MAKPKHTTNRLALLAAEIKAAHEDARGKGEYSAERAVDAGRGLAEAKQWKDRRGNLVFETGADWRAWVEEEAGVPYSTAQYYIQLIVGIDDRVLTSEIIAKVGQQAALKLIAAAKTQARREASRNAEPLPDGMDLRIGDARIVLADVPDNSVPLVLTDPPYGDEAEPLYRWLAQWAARVLIPGGSLICYTGQSRLNRDMAIFDAQPGLRYWWLMAMLHTQSQQFPGKFVMCEFKPVLWFVKRHRRGRTLVPDVLRPPNPEKGEHAWGQGEGGVHFLIEHLTDPKELIVDPFAGTATWGRIAVSMGRRWLGADVAEGGRAAVVA